MKHLIALTLLSHTSYVGKWTATAARTVVIRVPEIGLHTLTYSEDLTSFKDVWNSKIPLTRTFSSK